MELCNQVNVVLNMYFVVAMDTNEQVPLACNSDKNLLCRHSCENYCGYLDWHS